MEQMRIAHDLVRLEVDCRNLGLQHSNAAEEGCDDALGNVNDDALDNVNDDDVGE